jgi:iron complex transport system substrate-binding protein
VKETSAFVLSVALFISLSCTKSAVQPGCRIVSLSPAMTETVFALGAGGLLVGVTTYCDYPAQALTKYKVGDFSNPSLERIVALKPSLVIVNLPEQNRIKRALEDMGIPVFVSAPSSLDEMYREMESLGVLTDRKAQAESIHAAMSAVMRPKSALLKKVYVELSPRPLVTVGRRSFLNEMITLAGGTNIFSDIDKDYPVVSQEEIVRRDPDIVIVLHPENIRNRLGWSNVAAVASGRIYTGLDPDILLRPGPRLVLGYEELRKIIE